MLNIFKIGNCIFILVFLKIVIFSNFIKIIKIKGCNELINDHRLCLFFRSRLHSYVIERNKTFS